MWVYVCIADICRCAVCVGVWPSSHLLINIQNHSTLCRTLLIIWSEYVMLLYMAEQ